MSQFCRKNSNDFWNKKMEFKKWKYTNLARIFKWNIHEMFQPILARIFKYLKNWREQMKKYLKMGKFKKKIGRFSNFAGLRKIMID